MTKNRLLKHALTKISDYAIYLIILPLMYKSLHILYCIFDIIILFIFELLGVIFCAPMQNKIQTYSST